MEGEGHVHQDGEEDDDHGHFDPHYWMDPENMEQMVYNIRDGLSQADPEHAGEYEENAAEQAGLLHTWDDALQDMIQEAEENAGVEISGLITFHDGFRYFAEAFDLPLLASIEEEEGSEASAKEINEIAGLVKEYSLPVIFTEVNGSDATAQAIARETGCAVAQLSMCMDGPGGGDAVRLLHRAGGQCDRRGKRVCRGRSDSMRRLKHGKMSGGCGDSCCLKLEGLNVRIQGEEILEDVSFHLHCGEITALIGPNGAGKSTLFRSILGQLPYSGSITFAPAGGARHPSGRRDGHGGTRPSSAMCPSPPASTVGIRCRCWTFSPPATARWPVCLPIPGKYRERCRRSLERVHGGDLLDKPMGGLSGGSSSGCCWPWPWSRCPTSWS